MTREELTPLFGLISAEAALRMGEREIAKLWLGGDNRNMLKLARQCEKRGINVERMDKETITNGCGDPGHGGVVLWVGSRPFSSLETLLTPVRGKKLLFLIEGIEDPYNFGTLARAVYAAGAAGLILPPRNWMSAAGIVARASAGTSEIMPMAVYQSADDLKYALSSGFRFIAAEEGAGARSIYDIDLTGNIVVGIGGERRGLSSEISALARQKAIIPYGREFGFSLPAHSAAAVIAFESLRQSRKLTR